MKKFAIGLVIVLLLSFVAAIIAQCTNGFTSSPKSFAVIYNGKYILNDKSGLSVSEGDTFEVKHYGDDARIDVTITPLKLNEDYIFEIAGREYSWNNDVMRSKNISKYTSVAVAIDQDKNTIRLVGGFRAILQAFATGEGVDGEVKILNVLPQTDMFQMDIKSGDSAIRLGCQLYSNITGIAIDNSSIIFGELK